MTIKGRTNRIYTGDFKKTVVEEVRNNNQSLKETGKKYNIDRKTIAKWERIYIQDGSDGLYYERRGRTTKLDNPNKGRPVNLNKQIGEDLIAEVQRLRMENEYLKKLNALVHQREVAANETRHK